MKQAIQEALNLLDSRDRGLLLVAIVIQVATSALDLVGVLLLGLVGALAVTTVQSQPAPQIVVDLANTFGLGELSDQELVILFAASAAVVLLTKSVVSSLLTRRVFVFLANRQALISARLARELLSRTLTLIQARSSQETAYALIQGAGAATISILGQLVIIITELSVLVVLAIALLLIDPLVTLGAIGFFALIAILLQRLMGTWASRLGRTGAAADINSLNTLQDAFSVYREILVLNRRDWYVDKFQHLRWASAGVTADRAFLLQVPKYVFEASLVVGGVALAGILLLSKDSVSAVGTLALFLAASSRVMPSLLRLQGAGLSLRDSAAAAAPTFALAHDLRLSRENPEVPRMGTVRVRDSATHDSLPGSNRLPVGVEVTHLRFGYPGGDEEILEDVSLRIQPGESLALVGRSGVGKSTLADLVMGVLEPTSGSVKLNDLPPRTFVQRYPGAVAYVPQHPVLISGSLRENVALGCRSDEVSDAWIWETLEKVKLDDAFRRLSSGLEALLGGSGARLSGGQMQRLGIARALLSGPSLIVMDEATSALDAETELAITQLMQSFQGHVTTVVIAHRISTVESAERVAYLDKGRISCVGSFEDVRSQVPSFRRHVDLMLH